MAKPVWRFVGGKRQLLSQIMELVPRSFNDYYEPFVGGGAVFFALQEAGLLQRFVYLSDLDEDLIALYRAVQEDPKELRRCAMFLRDEMSMSTDFDAYYMKLRDTWNAGSKTPALNLFLRCASFNGVWRVNKEGKMNVPWRKAAARIPELDELFAASEALKGVSLASGPFHMIKPKANDFVYIDSPYLGGFVGYTAAGWGEADAVQLLQCCARWAADGAHVMVSHSDTPVFRGLVREQWPEATIHAVKARRNVNSDGTGRGPVGEVILTCGREIK